MTQTAEAGLTLPRWRLGLRAGGRHGAWVLFALVVVLLVYGVYDGGDGRLGLVAGPDALLGGRGTLGGTPMEKLQIVEEYLPDVPASAGGSKTKDNGLQYSALTRQRSILSVSRTPGADAGKSGRKRAWEPDSPPNQRVFTQKTTVPPVIGPWQDPVNCSLLFRNDAAEIQRAIEKRSKDVFPFPTDSDFVGLTQDCQAFRSRGYVTSSLSREEADFPLAFGIRMHRSVAQAEMLLRALYRPQNYYCIYIDKKSPAVIHRAMAGIAGCLDHVFIASHLENFVYASFSPVQADLQCMRDLVQISQNWTYFLNMAGTEYPLKTNLEIVRILKVLNGTNDIEQIPYPEAFRWRNAVEHHIVGGTLIKTEIPKPLFAEGKIPLQKGCSYNSFSRPFVEWVLSDPLAQGFINWTRNTHSPDEVAWASLNHIPEAPGGYQDMVTQVAKTFLSREVIWITGTAYCHGQKFVRGICIMSLGDLNWLSRRWELIANKFDPGYDAIVLQCLEEALVNRTQHPDPDGSVNWDSVYRAPHVPHPDVKAGDTASPG